jgi:hypothetical protein
MPVLTYRAEHSKWGIPTLVLEGENGLDPLWKGKKSDCM